MYANSLFQYQFNIILRCEACNTSCNIVICLCPTFVSLFEWLWVNLRYNKLNLSLGLVSVILNTYSYFGNAFACLTT